MQKAFYNSFTYAVLLNVSFDVVLCLLSEEHLFELLLKHRVDTVSFRRVNLFALDTKMRLLDSLQIAVLVWPKPVQYLTVFARRSAELKFANETMNAVIFQPHHLFL